MGSPAVKSHKRIQKSTSASQVCMTTSVADECLVESKLFSWMRLFRFVSLLCRQE
ncbi:uncharacterized protein LOC129952229 [Eupeodes corollae]|uniref:uncharacterized protein LOC129952229 n=1 Tax=Eupeodes corollae TaxID=290404 RepID=UPI00248F4D9B|nr:uncharacterized protein LOC129952229 [Eupeodes corollae]XP_055920692.1 uncharacterized protein LOC129952229 [Eupeodes corollae]